MKNLLIKDIKLMIQVKKLIVSFIVFLLIFILFAAMFSNFMAEKRILDQVHIGIIDEEKSFLTSMLLDNFKQNEAFSGLFKIDIADEDTLLDKYHNNELSALVYLPSDFTDSLLRFENTPMRITFNPNYPLKNTVLTSIMGSYSTFIKSVDVGIYSLYNVLKDEGLDRTELLDINEKFSVNMVMNALNRNELFEYEAIDTYPSASSSDYFIYSIMILIILFIATSGSSLFSDEIENQSLQRFKATGGSMFKFSLSKSCILSLNIILTLLPMVLIMIYLNKSISYQALSLMIGFLILVTLLFVVTSLTIGLLFNKYKVNLLMSTMLTLVLGIIGGQFIPIQVMPKFIQDISSLTPNYWILRTCLYLNQNLITKDYWIISAVIILLIVIMTVIQNIILQRTHIWGK